MLNASPSYHLIGAIFPLVPRLLTNIERPMYTHGTESTIHFDYNQPCLTKSVIRHMGQTNQPFQGPKRDNFL